jgi:hypothetical protein
MQVPAQQCKQPSHSTATASNTTVVSTTTAQHCQHSTLLRAAIMQDQSHASSYSTATTSNSTTASPTAQYCQITAQQCKQPQHSHQQHLSPTAQYCHPQHSIASHSTVPRAMPVPAQQCKQPQQSHRQQFPEHTVHKSTLPSTSLPTIASSVFQSTILAPTAQHQAQHCQP